MESLSYTSCIKINGVPLLPPVMTDDIKAEMNYYKNLAIAVEEKQKDLRTIHNIRKNTIKYSTHIVTNYDETESETEYVHQKGNKPLRCNNENVSINTILDAMSEKANEILPAQNEDIISLMNAKKSNTHKLEPKVFQNTQNRKSISNDNILAPNREDLLDKIESRSASVINNTELIPQVSKPEVPTSLDIIPITMDQSLNKQDTNATTTLETNNTHQIPKLVRQGSYVLEAPSPMLVAHLQSESLNENDIPRAHYIPTSTSTVRRKEWKITQGETEWKSQTKDEQCMIMDSSNKYGRIVYPSKKSISITPTVYQPAHKSRAKIGIDIPRLTRSVDSIQGMSVEECTKNENDNKNVFYNQRHKSNVNVEINYAPQMWQANKNVCILNLENKLNRSLGNLNTGMQCSKRIEKGTLENFTKDNEDYKALNDNNIQNSTSELLSSMTSEKLILILRQIQEVHKKQILQLVTCQQRAQILLQKEFEKQQMVLLTHIKRSLPETSEIISSIHFNTTTNCNEDSQSIVGTSTADLDDLKDLNCRRKLKKAEIISLRNDQIEKLPCPLNHTFPNNESVLDTRKWCQSSTTVKTYPQSIIDLTPLGRRDCEQLHNINNYNGDSKSTKQHEGINISRQLFPLNCNTTHVPNLDHIGYTKKHVHAASVINAYARGYLVRRLMITERVFRLKSTYKEALQCMLRLHIDAPLNLPELNFLHRLQLQCDAASMNIVDLFAQTPAQRMQVISHDRELKRSRSERPSSTPSYSFATQRTLARKRFREIGICQPFVSHSYSSRSRCQTWSSDIRENPMTAHTLYQGIKRSTSAGAVRKPWR